MLPVLLTDTVTNDLARAVDLALLWGLEGVELRTVGGPDNRVPHVNEAAIADRLWEQELPVAALAPSIFEGSVAARPVWLNELAMMEETLRFADRVSCDLVLVSGFAAADAHDPEAAAEALRRAGAKAATYNVRLAVVNEAPMAHPTGADVARLLDAVAHPHVGAAWSPVDAWQVGEPPTDGLAALGDRLWHVRCADGVMGPTGWRDTSLGEGEIGWPTLLRQLHATGYTGAVSLEVYVEPRRTAGLRMATRLIELIDTTR